jgi:hypothetical protein
MGTAATKQRGGSAEKLRDEDQQRDGHGAPHKPQKSKEKLDRELDKELMDSFPSSDPPAASQPTGAEPAGDPKTKP